MITVRGAMSDFVKVLDFGLVKKMNPGDVQTAPIAGFTPPSLTAASHLASTVRTIVDGPQSQRRDDTLEGQFMGTAGYASPEAVVGGTTDSRSDIYAVGAIWFALLTGRPAFDEPGASAIFAAQLREQPARRPSSLVDGVPPEVDDLIMRCLARDPGQRPQSIDHLLAVLLRDDLPRWSADSADLWWRDRSTLVRNAARNPHGEPTTRRSSVVWKQTAPQRGGREARGDRDGRTGDRDGRTGDREGHTAGGDGRTGDRSASA
jgi:serine/threonine protein kinase